MPTKPFSVLEDQIREAYGRVVYTHKAHEKMADILTKKLNRYKWCEIGLAAVTSSAILVSFGVEERWFKILTAVVSLASVWVTSMSKGFDFGGEAQKHRDAASKLWPIRESYFSLLTDIRADSVTDDIVRDRRDKLQDILAAIYTCTPQTNDKAYLAAQKALKKDEDLTFSKEEINNFLPESLKKH